MRKTLIGHSTDALVQQGPWLDLENIARVEISSEDPLAPIEHALRGSGTQGWRASGTGPQVIRLRFDDSIALHHVQLRIVEREVERTQELSIFVETGGQGLREIRRQQFTFSPHGATEEIEDFSVDLANVTLLELRIDPDRNHNPGQSQTCASLASLRLA